MIELQKEGSGTLEKETLALVTSIMNFRDMIEAAPITFIITDCGYLYIIIYTKNSYRVSI
jgi:hypothetical protein